MEVTGRVVNGAIVLNGSQALPEGAEVRVTVLPLDSDPGQRPVRRGGTLYDRLQDVIGSVELPEDFSAQHDHYIHGTDKRP